MFIQHNLNLANICLTFQRRYEEDEAAPISAWLLMSASQDLRIEAPRLSFLLRSPSFLCLHYPYTCFGVPGSNTPSQCQWQRDCILTDQATVRRQCCVPAAP